MSEPYEQLDEAMEARRLDLRMSWVDVARTAGISPQALRAIRRGESRPSRLTARALDEALRWEPDSVEAVLDGEEPTPLGRTVTGTARADLSMQASARGTARSPREERQAKIAEAKRNLLEALGEESPAPVEVESVDEFRLEERVARLRRLMAQRRDTESAAELDLMLRMYEEETG